MEKIKGLNLERLYWEDIRSKIKHINTEFFQLGNNTVYENLYQ